MELFTVTLSLVQQFFVGSQLKIKNLEYTGMSKSVIDMLNDLEQRTKYLSKTVIGFKYFDEAQLCYKPSPKSWSAFECISHLNQYYVFYLPLIRQAIASNKKHKGYLVFKPGILGAFFISLLEPRKGGIRKLKAVSAMLPKSSTLNRSELKHFIMYQKELLSLLETCKDYDINSIFVRSVMSKWVTLSLGDTFRFLIIHNERHVLQAQNTLKSKNLAVMGL